CLIEIDPVGVLRHFSSLLLVKAACLLAAALTRRRGAGRGGGSEIDGLVRAQRSEPRPVYFASGNEGQEPRLFHCRHVPPPMARGRKAARSNLAGARDWSAALGRSSWVVVRCGDRCLGGQGLTRSAKTTLAI